MNDLISKSQAKQEILAWAVRIGAPQNLSTEDTMFVIDNLPAVDAEPVRHARWLLTNDDNKKRCSRCDVIHLIAQYPHGQANYCPNCGAKMDAEVEG